MSLFRRRIGSLGLVAKFSPRNSPARGIPQLPEDSAEVALNALGKPVRDSRPREVPPELRDQLFSALQSSEDARVRQLLDRAGMAATEPPTASLALKTKLFEVIQKPPKRPTLLDRVLDFPNRVLEFFLDLTGLRAC